MREEANREVAEALCTSPDRRCGDSRAGAVDADGVAGPRAGGCLVSSGRAYHSCVLARTATDDPDRLSWTRGQRVDQPASGRRDHCAHHCSIRASGSSRVEYQRWGAGVTRVNPPWAVRRRSCGDSRWTQGASPRGETWGDSAGESDRAADCPVGL